MAAHWSENWRKYHLYGLESILVSGRVRATLFTKPKPLSTDLMSTFAGYAPWVHFIAGRLLAGAGVEILLKGLYLKNGYSIRNPKHVTKEPLAQRGSAQDKSFNPRVSASLGTLLRPHNLTL